MFCYVLLECSQQEERDLNNLLLWVQLSLKYETVCFFYRWRLMSDRIIGKYVMLLLICYLV